MNANTNFSTVSAVAFDFMLVVAARIAEAGLRGSEEEQEDAAKEYRQHCSALSAEARKAFDSAIAQAAMLLK